MKTTVTCCMMHLYLGQGRTQLDRVRGRVWAGRWGVLTITTMMFYPTDLLRELLASEEEAQQAADDHSQHRQDEQSVLLADILHPPPHFIQSHRHPPPPPPIPPRGPKCNFTRPPSEKPPPQFSKPKNPLFSHKEPTVATTALAKKPPKKQKLVLGRGWMGVIGGWKRWGWDTK